MDGLVIGQRHRQFDSPVTFEELRKRRCRNRGANRAIGRFGPIDGPRLPLGIGFEDEVEHQPFLPS